MASFIMHENEGCNINSSINFWMYHNIPSTTTLALSPQTSIMTSPSPPRSLSPPVTSISSLSGSPKSFSPTSSSMSSSSSPLSSLSSSSWDFNSFYTSSFSPTQPSCVTPCNIDFDLSGILSRDVTGKLFEINLNTESCPNPANSQYDSLDHNQNQNHNSQSVEEKSYLDISQNCGRYHVNSDIKPSRPNYHFQHHPPSYQEHMQMRAARAGKREYSNLYSKTLEFLQSDSEMVHPSTPDANGFNAPLPPIHMTSEDNKCDSLESSTSDVETRLSDVMDLIASESPNVQGKKCHTRTFILKTDACMDEMRVREGGREEGRERGRKGEEQAIDRERG